MMSRPNQTRLGFTLIELLVVIAIMAILVAMLVPAVQRVRQSALLTQCRNNLKQIALATHTYHDAHHVFPSGGWGWNWIGDPFTVGYMQPGGPLWSILPFIEQQNLFNMGVSSTIEEMMQLTVPQYNCPARRSGGPYPYITGNSLYFGSAIGTTEILTGLTHCVRNDYAACSGDDDNDQADGGPDLGTGTTLAAQFASGGWNEGAIFTGVFYQASSVKLTDITNGRGSSNVFLWGEKYITPTDYYNGEDGGDNEAPYVGFDNDTTRTTYNLPLQDRINDSNTLVFGSAHVGGLNMAMCDGSVQFFEYSVTSTVWGPLGRIRD
jgi:prepilin-type N-terminal cleavage/methylation domain-containing protein/prepilin-type processing-associated H-X9-DG protein